MQYNISISRNQQTTIERLFLSLKNPQIINIAYEKGPLLTSLARCHSVYI